MSIFESIVDSLKSQIERQAAAAVDIEKSKADVLNDSITAYLNQKKPTLEVVEGQPETTPEAIKKIKSKGIALTAAAQGGLANGRPVSLLMKSSGQQNVIRRQLILKSAANTFAGATLIRKSDGTLLSENGMQITKGMHELMDQLGIEYTIRDEDK
ncbi:hypothetical protein [Serratia ficaria]|uniref:hypothetical protein n=1 Tax=Serratia ficaria TaxID=61651 RepID=UPI00217B91E3|nr:hypothetical protein [Serratia ficaria]CAI1090434.1 Uncharacterised protein [Serratia ficaria]CAI2495713.1 Uncharacterised protein [Serratia ficaria]CAI2519635.1 Uncharacterised protein [Serratia ficaria]CAI2790113.1 Uncharacterised protein [Serratia ficaria]